MSEFVINCPCCNKQFGIMLSKTDGIITVSLLDTPNNSKSINEVGNFGYEFGDFLKKGGADNE